MDKRSAEVGVMRQLATLNRIARIAIQDLALRPMLQRIVDTLHGDGSELCVPVIHDGEVLAVLNAESRRVGAFDGQRALLETVADQIAGAIRVANLLDNLQRTNVQLHDAYAKLEGLSRTDDLTGVANRRCFDIWLDKALADAALSGKSLALLMIDVDHFKSFNDGYGHLAGDGCLQHVAALLAYFLEGTAAKLARYGGEEFVVILPDTDRDTAAPTAERLRLAIQARELENSFARPGFVSISVGVAACRPDATTDADGLIAPADAALYAAKRAGRNRIRVATD